MGGNKLIMKADILIKADMLFINQYLHEMITCYLFTSVFAPCYL